MTYRLLDGSVRDERLPRPFQWFVSEELIILGLLPDFTFAVWHNDSILEWLAPLAMSSSVSPANIEILPTCPTY